MPSPSKFRIQIQPKIRIRDAVKTQVKTQNHICFTDLIRKSYKLE